MGELEGSYRVIQTPGTRLGAPFNAGISTLEAGQALSVHMSSAAGRNYGRGLQMRVVGLDDSQEFYDMEVSDLWPVLLYMRGVSSRWGGVHGKMGATRFACGRGRVGTAATDGLPAGSRCPTTGSAILGVNLLAVVSSSSFLPSRQIIVKT